MMWAATVRRCPTGHSRHPSQFGARLQLARALTHAPYLICDGVYSCPPPVHSHYNSEVNVPYRISYGEPNTLSESNSICDHIVDCESQSFGQPISYANRSVYTQGVYASSRHYCNDNLNSTGPPSSAFVPRGRLIPDPDEVRVELPYSRRELEVDDDYPLSERIIRRYDDIQGRDDVGDEGIVGLSYQQRSMGDRGPYGGEVWGAEPSIDCWGDRPLLLKRGRTRELVRTMFVVSLSFLLVTFVVMGFEVYNMLITSIFILFFLSTLCLLLFLVIRKPTCLSCCNDSLDESDITEATDTQQQEVNAYLSESQGVILKKRLSDSPPPYESPPDYHSLPPEILVSARVLSGLEEAPESTLTRVHGEEQASYGSSQRDTSRPNTKHSSRLRNFASRSSSSLLASAAPLLSSSKHSTSRSSLPTSPALCTSSVLFGSSCKSQRVTVPNVSNLTSSSSPPPYECVVFQSETTKGELKPC